MIYEYHYVMWLPSNKLNHTGPVRFDRVHSVAGYSESRRKNSNMFLCCVLAIALVISSRSSAFHTRDITLTREPTKSPGYGGVNGTAFDDLSFEDYIVGVHPMALSLYMAPIHGKIGDAPINITLDSNEYVSKIEGKIYNHSQDVLIGQLTITTLGPEYVHKIYGPFGRIGVQNFSEEGYIFGFHGRSGDALDNIGVYSLEL